MAATKTALKIQRASASVADRDSSPEAQILEIEGRLAELDSQIKLLEKVRAALLAAGEAQNREDVRRSDADADLLDLSEDAISRASVLAQPSEMAKYLQGHLGQKLTAYLAGLKDAKTVGQWARGKVQPPALTRERLRAAFHATELLRARYGDEAAQGWFFGANSSLDYRAPAAVLREAETPDELTLIVPLARAFVRGAH